MARNPAFVGDAWSFWLGPIQADGVLLTGSTPGLVVSASVLLNNDPWGGPFTPTYDTGLSRWTIAIELPGPGEVVVRWLVTYEHPTLGPVMKTVEQSLYVESRKPPVTVEGQTNLNWDAGPAGPPGPTGEQGPPGADATITVGGGSPVTAQTLDFAVDAFGITETSPGVAEITPAFGTTVGTIAQGDHLHDDRYMTDAEISSLITTRTPTITRRNDTSQSCGATANCTRTLNCSAGETAIDGGFTTGANQIYEAGTEPTAQTPPLGRIFRVRNDQGSSQNYTPWVLCMEYPF